MRGKIKIPNALTEADLERLCDEYRDVIGGKVPDAPKPDIRIRYVIDRDRFGYARFGDFFFIETGDLYVWTRDKEFEEDHNPDMVEYYLGEDCKRKGYCHRAIFAGVRTGYRDTNGDDIYTGDVIDLNGEYMDRPLALGTLGQNEDGREAYYAFVLDNHCILPERCKRMTRIGTVFYQLDWCDEPRPVAALSSGFQPCYPDGVSLEDRIVMARYTPNFDQEIWKYHGCEILGIEFHWRK